MEAFEKFKKLRDLIGDDSLFCEISNYFSSDELNDFCESVISEYDLENEFE